MTTKAEKAASLADALENLARYLPAPVKSGERNERTGHQAYESRPTVYAIVRHVAKSGMSRDIAFYVVHNGEMICLTWSIATVCGYSMKNEGVHVGGCGMDMRFAVLDTLAHRLAQHGRPEFRSGNDFRIEGL